jgi:quinol-cytochrome oxidoreductase complex cytochrome b subunit
MTHRPLSFTFIFLLLLAVFVFTAPFAGAQETPTQLVPECDSVGGVSSVCGFCDLFKLVQNVLNFVFWVITIPLAIVFVVYAGFLMIAPWTNQNLIQRGKKVLWNVFIGVIIIFIAWLAIDTIIKLLANQSLVSGSPARLPLGPWNQIECPITYSQEVLEEIHEVE